MQMKVITLIQPWATLIALGEKKIETRSWHAKYRGPLLIHAGKKVDKKICLMEPFKSVLEKHGYNLFNLPTGVIIAETKLNGCVKILDNRTIDTKPWTEVIGNEFYFGDYTPGRFAWLLGYMKMLDTPIPAKGQLNLWNYDMPSDILTVAEELKQTCVETYFEAEVRDNEQTLKMIDAIEKGGSGTIEFKRYNPLNPT